MRIVLDPVPAANLQSLPEPCNRGNNVGRSKLQGKYMAAFPAGVKQTASGQQSWTLKHCNNIVYTSSVDETSHTLVLVHSPCENISFIKNCKKRRLIITMLIITIIVMQILSEYLAYSLLPTAPQNTWHASTTRES